MRCYLLALGRRTDRDGEELILVLAWAYFAGLMSSSFWSQLEETLRQTSTEPHNMLVVVVKFFLWAICIASLVLATRRAILNQK